MKKNLCIVFFRGLTAAMILFVAMPGYCRTLSEILDQGTLKIGMIAEKDYPFVFKDKMGKMAGFDVRMSHDIANKLGVRAVIHRTAETYDRLTEMLRKGEVDVVVSNYTITLNRARYILYSEPYARIPLGVLINTVWYAKNKKNGVVPLKRLDRTDVTMGTVRSSAMEKHLKHAFPHVKAKKFANTGDLGRALLNGEINTAFCTMMTSHFITQQHKNRRLMIREEPVPGIIDRIGIGISPNAYHLKFWLDEYIRNRNMPFSVDEILRSTDPSAF
ncbi:MAG: hypothetical protein B6240_06935 [Desulfobacteraceae bacterium 4572_87]|nr:MAG: hypothetical protein B6240_06935 [Desulfobacteraceae bacterium 4572_87]